jgi:hypothetical protein
VFGKKKFKLVVTPIHPPLHDIKVLSEEGCLHKAGVAERNAGLPAHTGWDALRPRYQSTFGWGSGVREGTVSPHPQGGWREVLGHQPAPGSVEERASHEACAAGGSVIKLKYRVQNNIFVVKK